MAEPDASELQALRVYDPDSPDAAARLELLEYLIGLGATAEDLVAYRGRRTSRNTGDIDRCLKRS